MHHEECEVADNVELASNIFLLRLESTKISRTFHPGQFVLLSFESDPTLPSDPRPFSPSRYVSLAKQDQAFQLEIIYKRYGDWTALLSSCRRGDKLFVSGPWGRGFTLDTGRRRLVLVAGGTGLTPLLALSQKLREIEVGQSVSKCRAKELRFLIGGRTEAELLRLDLLQELASETLIATDDGSSGFKGPVTGLLRHVLCEMDDAGELQVYSSGPKGMMREMLEIASAYGLPCELSLETIFSCGVGVCGACIVGVKSGAFTNTGYAKVCSDGPVFDAHIIESIDML